MRYHQCSWCNKEWECDRWPSQPECGEPYRFGYCTTECVRAHHEEKMSHLSYRVWRRVRQIF